MDKESINELIDKLKNGEIEGTIEIRINHNGKVNKIEIKKEGERKKRNIINSPNPNLSGVNFSGLNISDSDFSGLNLQGANFSYAVMSGSDLSYSNLQEASFYKARISQTNFSNSYGEGPSGAYMTGSVNLYGVSSSARGGHPWSGTIKQNATNRGSASVQESDPVFYRLRNRNY